ncbi:hypothetical protein [Nocardia nepalensis]|uniref:hypothetical protein n=1 Tax=Nocardia nepalensis TaxID=3375448 RepID=UPI003B67C601
MELHHQPRTPHFRRSYATELSRRGVRAEIVQTLMDHSSITHTYAISTSRTYGEPW